MNCTLLVDDKDSFVELLTVQAEQWNVTDVLFCRDPDAAFSEFLSKRPRRVIADNTFEGFREDGLTLLERMRSEDAEVELILLTGNETTSSMEKRLRDIRGLLIPKGEVDSELMERLLSGRELPSIPTSDSAVDVAELKLRLEEAQQRLQSVEETNIMLVSDIVDELTKAQRNGEPGLIIEGRRYSPADLILEAVNHTPVGKELVENHHKMFLLLRGGTK